MNRILKHYFAGWRALLKGCIVATIWMLLVILPAYVFVLLFPDEMEGKAEGAKWVRPTCALVLIIWAPIAAGALGALRFQKASNGE